MTTRRDFIKKASAAGVGLLAAAYVKPEMKTVAIQPAFAQGTGMGDQQGCTPGYWKNHNDWPSSYRRDDRYSQWFAIPMAYLTIFQNKTLREVLYFGEGGAQALARHSVAALLNAAMLGGSSFRLSESDVIVKTNAALASLDCDKIEALKDEFENLNEGSCSLGGRIA